MTVDQDKNRDNHTVFTLASAQWWTGQPPRDVAVDQYFDVKIQVGPTADVEFLLYDKTKEFRTRVHSRNCPKYHELFHLIRSFAPCAGRKAYMRARVNATGELVLSTSPLFVRKW